MIVTVAEALNDLAGYTPLQIAEKLSADGLLTCSDLKPRSTSCPIAQYLKQRTGLTLSISPYQIEGSPTPHNISRFICLFDACVYEHLRNDRLGNK